MRPIYVVATATLLAALALGGCSSAPRSNPLPAGGTPPQGASQEGTPALAGVWRGTYPIAPSRLSGSKFALTLEPNGRFILSLTGGFLRPGTENGVWSLKGPAQLTMTRGGFINGAPALYTFRVSRRALSLRLANPLQAARPDFAATSQFPPLLLRVK